MDLALLVLRLVVGLIFAAHGAQKLFGAFGGPGIQGTAGFFDQIGLRPGKLHGWAAGITEFFGGFAIALGLVTPVAAAALIAVMTAAVLVVHAKNGFFNTNQGFEFNLALAGALFALAGTGAGGWSLDNALGIDMTGAAWALGALGVGLLGGVGAVLSGRFASREHHGHGHPSTA
ncbi:MAG: DoxX family protein [Solirubrobacterales bacterium]